jgi:hypothetical protein
MRAREPPLPARRPRPAARRCAPGGSARRHPAAWAGRAGGDPDDRRRRRPDARLELRRTLLPSGVEVELIVLTGERITLTVDDLVIVGSRIELDVDGRLVRVIGPGSFTSGEERLEGDDLELRLDEERVRAIDAIVFTSAIDVTGELAERLPGQLTFTDGLASPCSRCSQEVLDYASAPRHDALPRRPAGRLRRGGAGARRHRAAAAAAGDPARPGRPAAAAVDPSGTAAEPRRGAAALALRRRTRRARHLHGPLPGRRRPDHADAGLAGGCSAAPSR